jgi:hypothetical protein
MTSFANFGPVAGFAGDPYPASPDALPMTPRQVETPFWTQFKRCALLAGLLLGPNVALVVGYLSGNELRLLRDSGTEITGKVEYKNITRGGRSGPTYRVSYLFKVDGQNQFKDTTVTKQEYDRLTEGGAVMVTYLPSDPKINCLGSPSHHLNNRIETTLFLAGLVAAGFGIAFICVEIAVRREIHLATNGLGTVGRIVDSGSQVTRNRTTRYWARYEFSSPVNKHAGSWHYVPQFIWDCIPRGQTVTILYDPQNPSHHLPLYAFKYVRVHAVPVAPPPALDPTFADHADAILRAPRRGPSTDIFVPGRESSVPDGIASRPASC